MVDQADARARQAELDRLADDCGCQICRANLGDRNGPRVMSAVAPRPGESLVGLVGRVARRNHLPRLRALLGACTSTWHAHFNLASRDDIDFGNLAHVARLAPHDLEGRRYRSTPLTSDLPGVEYHGAIIPAYDLQLRPRRLATSWLVDEPYHCALGHHALATHCPISGHLLIDRCHCCNARLNWSSLDLTRCSACGYDLRTAVVQRVTERQLHATRPMLDLIHPEPDRNRAAASRLPDLLSELDRGTVFELGWRFGNLMSGGGNGRRTAARHLPVESRLRILEIGSAVLLSWPENIRLAMQGVPVGGTGNDPKLPRAVRSLAKASNAWPEFRDAIFAAVPGLAVSAKTGVRSVLPKAANGAELARSLGVTQRLFERMRNADVLSPVSASGTVNQHQIFDAGDSEHLQRLFADRVPLSSASERLDISVHGAEQLCCLGELRLLDDDAVLAALKRRQITKSSLEILRSRLEKMGINSEETTEGDFLPIHRALRSFGGREKPWGPIVVAMLVGELPFVIGPDKTGRLMDRVSITARSIPILAAMHFDVKTYSAFAFDFYVNRRDAEEILNVDPPAFSRAMKNAELPLSRGSKYNRDDIIKLAAKTLSVSEALIRWGHSGKRLPKPLRGPGAPSRGGKLGWDRAEAEKAMEERAPPFSARIEVRPLPPLK
jgi:hypothetical protein